MNSVYTWTDILDVANYLHSRSNTNLHVFLLADFLLSKHRNISSRDWNSSDKNSVDNISRLAWWRRCFSDVARRGRRVSDSVQGDVDGVAGLHGGAARRFRRPVRRATGPHVVDGRRPVMIGVGDVCPPAWPRVGGGDTRRRLRPRLGHLEWNALSADADCVAAAGDLRQSPTDSRRLAMTPGRLMWAGVIGTGGRAITAWRRRRALAGDVIDLGTGWRLFGLKIDGRESRTVYNIVTSLIVAARTNDVWSCLALARRWRGGRVNRRLRSVRSAMMTAGCANHWLESLRQLLFLHTVKYSITWLCSESANLRQGV